jgi:transposase
MFCGIDWSDDHHDVAVVDDNGAVIAQLRIGNDAEGFGQLGRRSRSSGLAPLVRCRWRLRPPRACWSHR